MPPKVLIAELGSSHNETLFTQVQALREQQVAVGLFLNERLRDRIHPAVLCSDATEFHACEGVRSHVGAALRIRSRLIRENYTHLVVNTGSGNAVRILSLFVPRGVRAVAVLHDSSKLSRSFSQACISHRFRDYLVLADHLVPEAPPSGLRIGAFYPLVFPDVPAPAEATGASAAGPFRVVVPGNVSYSRRDYEGLVALWKAVSPETREQLEIEILGDIDACDGPRLLELMKASGVGDAFVVHHGFIPEELFYSRLARADAVLPLIHPAMPDFERYLRCKISGAFNLAYGLNKPLLMHSRFASIPDFEQTSVFYEYPALPSVADLKLARARITARYARSQFHPSVQQERYRRFVLG